MRLTLRTLLAYLDDILEPAEAKEIGSKLSESGLASSLVSRIREVMRRRRLTAPALSGPGVGIDPNTIAEYLDNTLPPDGVADVEKICLESDVHLAEAAACHQILTLALGEPVEVAQTTRERMYALGPSGAKMSFSSASPRTTTEELPSEALDDVLGQAESLSSRGRQAGKTALAAAVEPHKQKVPEYLRPQTSWAKVAGYTALALLLCGWGVLASKYSPLKLGRENTEPGSETTTRTAPKNDNATVPEQAEPEVALAPLRSATAAALPSATEKDLTTPLENQAELETPFVRQSDLPPDESRNVVILPKPADNPEPEGNTAVSVPPAPVSTPEAHYTSADGIGLRFDAEKDGWFVLKRGAKIDPGSLLVAPDPFESNFELADKSASITLPGRTAVQWLAASDAGRLALELRRGKIVVRTPSASADANDPLKFALTMGGAVWKFEIQPGTVCGIDLIPKEASKFQQLLAPSDYTGGIFVSSGEAAVTDPVGKTTFLHSPVWLRLPHGGTAENLVAIPQWLNRQSLGGAWEPLARAFERRFNGDESIDLAMPGVADDLNPHLARLATDCLGLIEAYRPVVKILQRTRHDEARRTAISALRVWLPRAEENRDLLKAELARLYPPEDAEVAYKLLWGFDADDLRDKDLSLQLVDWMAHPEISIRELAFYDVSRLTQKTHEYRPSLKPLQIQSTVATWRRYVLTKGALLPPQATLE